MTPITRSYQNVRRTAVAGGEVAVAAARRESVDAALAILEAGGNAVDAAVACGFVAGVVEPMETCLAGSGFLLAWDPGAGRATAVDFPPRAPLAARPDMYEVVPSAGASRLLGVSAVRDDANTEGVLAPGVPGTIAGLLAAHERLGRLPRQQVLEPAIRAAADGFIVDGYYALEALDHLETLRAHPDAAAIYLDARGLPPVPAFLGDASLGVAPRLRQPDLARTLELVTARGVAGFYEGEIALAIERHFASHGGLITRADLSAYRPLVGEPLRVGYGDHTLLAPCSPCGAWTELQILRVLERLGLGGTEVDDPDALESVIAASRWAFADRYHWLGDPYHVPVPLSGLLSDGYAEPVAAAVRTGAAAPSFEFDVPPWEALAFEAAGDPWRFDAQPERRQEFHPPTPTPAAADRHGTTHFAVVDADGMMVSCTHSAGNAFGSKVVAAGTGVLFDAAMTWFNAVPGAANSIAPGKRPLVNMGPLLVVGGDGRPRLAIGAPGGRRIIDAVVQVVVNVLDRKLSIEDAIGTPRVDASGAAVLASDRLDGALDALRSRGHNVVPVREQHAPFGYELARPVGVEIAGDGSRRAGADPLTQGHAAAW